MKSLSTKSRRHRLGIVPNRAAFLRAAKGRRAAAKGVVVQYVGEAFDDAHIEVGFTASKKVGKAVERNRAKRRLREVARMVLGDHAREAGLYVLIARGETLNRPFDRLKADLRWAVEKVHGGERGSAQK